MIQQQTSDPDFIPFSGGGAPAAAPDFIPYQAGSTAPESQSSSVLRFLKAGGKQLYAGTAGSGPQQSGTMTQDFSAQQAQAKAGTLPSAWQTLKNSASDISPSNIDIGRTLSSVNPVDVQRFQSGDVAGGLGSTAANLLMLRQAFKSRGLPEFNAPNTSEIVQPLSGGTKPAPQQAASPATPVQAPQSNSILPNATYLQPEMRALPSAKTRLPDEINKNTNTLAQEYFIQKMRDAMNRQTVTGSAEQDAVMQRMAEYAKTPVDKMQGSASGPVEAEPGGHAGGGVTSAEELNRPGANYIVSPSGNLTYHGKAFAPEQTPNGASHVTALPDGTLRVNAGKQLTPAQEMAVRKATGIPKPMTTGGDLIQALRQMAAKGKKASSATAGGDD